MPGRMPNLFLVLGLPLALIAAATALAAAASLVIGMLMRPDADNRPVRRWMRRHVVSISLVSLLAAGAFSIGGTCYAIVAGPSDPTLKIALVGDVLVGGAGLLALVAGGLAAATYSLAVSPPRLRVRVQFRECEPVLLEPYVGLVASPSLDVQCSSGGGGLHRLAVDPVQQTAILYMALVNDADVTAANVLFEVGLMRLTGVPTAQAGWTVIPPREDRASRAFFWEGGADRAVVGDAERPLPPIDLARGSIAGDAALVSFYVQADRFKRTPFRLELRPLQRQRSSGLSSG